MKTLIVDTDDVLALFGVSDRDIYAKGTIEDAIYDGTLKPAETERKTGRWIDTVIPTEDGGLPIQICDQCNAFFSLACTGGGHKFCPNCGAKMENDL